MNATASSFDPDRDALKRAAAEAAVQLVESDMVVGLGSGSTAAFAVEALATAPSTPFPASSLIIAKVIST